MNIDLWQAVLAVMVVAATVGSGSRWWFRRQLAALQRRHDKLDASHQSTQRMMSQARKQIDDLQRLVAEYRRKLAANEQERRRVSAKLAISEALEERPAPGSGLAPVRPPPGGWADTQPM
jgi:septal ring factor EnvC (AmiA/AmiB activator)